MLEASPKVALGRQNYEAPVVVGNELITDFDEHAEDYAALGVSKEDLQYVQYVRNGAGVIKDAKVK